MRGRITATFLLSFRAVPSMHKDMINQLFQRAIANLMTKYKLSQGRLAEIMGKDQSTVSRLIKGRIVPSLSNVYAIAKICKAFPADARVLLDALPRELQAIVTIELTRDAFPERIRESRPIYDVAHGNDERIAKWAEWLRSLPPEDRNDFFDLVRAFAKRFPVQPPA